MGIHPGAPCLRYVLHCVPLGVSGMATQDESKAYCGSDTAVVDLINVFIIHFQIYGLQFCFVFFNLNDDMAANPLFMCD